MKKKQWLSGLLATTLVLLTVTGCIAKPTGGNAQATVTIFHTNDLHGKVNSTYQDGELTQIGLDVVKSAKDSTPDSLLLDGGDATQGVALASYTKGRDIIKLMNAAGYDAMVLGNHEFDYGTEQLLQNAQAASFPLLSANALRDGEPITAGIRGSGGGWMVQEVAGKKIGIFGLTTTETAYKTNPQGLDGVVFEDEVETARRMVAQLREEEKVDAVVALVHMGIADSTQVTSHRLAEEVEGIDVIIDGHSHSTDQTTVGATHIVQTGTGARNLGKITLSFTKKGVEVESQLLTAQEVGQQYAADGGLTALYEQMMTDLAPILEEKVGYVTSPLYGGTYEEVNICRVGETNLGSLVADAMAKAGTRRLADTPYATLPVVALQNGGSIRTTVPAGPVTVGDINSVLPFGNTLAVKEITPAILYQALENGVAKAVDQGNGAFPQVSGMRFTYDIVGSPRVAGDAAQPGGRVVEVVLLDAKGRDKTRLDREDTTTRLALVSNDFEVAGGDNYDMLGALPTIAEGATLDKVLEEHIRTLCKTTGSFSAPLYGRITLLDNGKAASPYRAEVTLLRGGAVLPNASVRVSVDGKAAVPATTDGSGRLVLAGLATGGHSLAITAGEEQAFVFVSDLAGLTQLDGRLERPDGNLPAGNPGTGSNVAVGVGIALLLSATTVLALRKKR